MGDWQLQWQKKTSQTRRPDSETQSGLTVAMHIWLKKPPFALDRADPEPETPSLLGRRKHIPASVYVPVFEFTTTDSKIRPGIKSSYSLLPFRALEENCLPVAIKQRWEASVAASMSAEWRLWFQTLEPRQQKAYVHSLAKETKDEFWASLYLEYETWQKPRRTRHVAAAAKALAILEQENSRRQMKQMRQMEESRRLWENVTFPPRFEPWMFGQPGNSPQEEYAEHLSAPATHQNLISLRLRLIPSYFRIPKNAFRFAEQIFREKSYDEAVAEQKANFNSWAREHQLRRTVEQPQRRKHWYPIRRRKIKVE